MTAREQDSLMQDYDSYVILSFNSSIREYNNALPGVIEDRRPSGMEISFLDLAGETSETGVRWASMPHYIRGTEFYVPNSSSPDDLKRCRQSLANLYQTWHAIDPGKVYDEKSEEWSSKIQ